MKNFYVLFLTCICIAPVQSQTLFTYGSYAVSKDEFLKAYNKNKSPVTDKEKSLREYLDLYSRFKLKVKAAEAQRLDTVQQLQYDLQNFRSQVEDGYLNDEKELAALVDEALERGKKDIHLLRFYIPVKDKMSEADSSMMYAAMNELSAALKTGKGSHRDMVAEINKKKIEIKETDLGYITALTLPYEIENLVYNLKPGEVSKPYRTKSALQLFLHAGERKSPGKWKVAQILISLPPGASAEQVKIAGKKADSIYQLAIKGANFSNLAKEYSEDKLTYLNGGELPELGTGKYEMPFETRIFELKKDGDISDPILTSFGYHIVKRLGTRDIPVDKSDEAYVASLKQQVIQDSRMNDARARFLEEVKTKTSLKRNNAIKDADLSRYADSVTATATIGNFPINNKTIFSFSKQAVKGIDWLNFVKDYKLNTDVYQGENNQELLEKYITTACVDYYRKHLEEYNKDFKFQLQEFKEGNMLFEIMERNVWSKAANDSVGLQNFYKQHQSSYKWNESAAVLLFNCSDSSTAATAIMALKNGKDWRLLAEESEGKVQSDSGRYEMAQLQLPAGTTIREGMISSPAVNSGDNTTSFVKVLKLFPGNQQRSFEEARGLVINEYQAYLEEQWVTQLKKTYPVKVNEPIFRSLLN